MLETVKLAKNVLNAVGTPTGKFAHVVTDRSVDLAHLVADRSVDLAQRISDISVDTAKRLSDITVDTAKRIGPKRALIGIAAIGALVGGAILIMRLLRDRADASNDAELDDGIDASGEDADGMSPRRKLSRAQRKQQRAAQMD